MLWCLSTYLRVICITNTLKYSVPPCKLKLFWRQCQFVVHKGKTEKEMLCATENDALLCKTLLHLCYWHPCGRSVQFISVIQLCPTLCNPMNCSTPGLPVHHQLLESTQTHVHWVADAIWPSPPLSSPSLPALNLSQHQGLFKWVSSLHQAAKVLDFQLQHQSYEWTPRTDLL